MRRAASSCGVAYRRACPDQPGSRAHFLLWLARLSPVWLARPNDPSFLRKQESTRGLTLVDPRLRGNGGRDDGSALLDDAGLVGHPASDEFGWALADSDDLFELHGD